VSTKISGLPDMFGGINENFITAAGEGVLVMAGSSVGLDALQDAAAASGVDILPVDHDVEKLSGQYIGLICAETLTCRGLNFNLRHFGSFTFILVSCEESRLLVSCCACGKCDMVGSDEVLDRSRRPDAEDRGWSSTGQVLGGWTIRRSGDVVCDLYRAHGDKEHGFLG
jgi:hypothetical protein